MLRGPFRAAFPPPGAPQRKARPVKTVTAQTTSPYPTIQHYRQQSQLVDALRRVAGSKAHVGMELPFRLLHEHEPWVADVALITTARWEASDEEDYFLGAPELVVEVLSPSNTYSEIQEKELVCLNNGALEFWVVDPIARRIRITSHDGRVTNYTQGASIPIALVDAALSADAIFITPRT